MTRENKNPPLDSKRKAKSNQPWCKNSTLESIITATNHQQNSNPEKKKLIIIIDFFLALPLGLQQSEGVQAVEEREKEWKREREILWRSQWCINWESNREKVDRERKGWPAVTVGGRALPAKWWNHHSSLPTHHAPIFMARLEHLKKWNFWKTLI